MSVRGGSRRVEYDERDTYYREEPARAPARTRVVEEETDVYTRRDRDNRPAFLNNDFNRVEAGGPLVLRQRDTESFARPIERRPRSLSPVRRVESREIRRVERSPTPRRVTESREVFTRRERSPSPVRRVETREVAIRRERSLSPVRSVVRERVIERSPSPPPQFREERYRTRVIEREPPSPPPDRLARRVIETREIRRRSPSPEPVRVRERIIERRRSSPPPVERESRTRIDIREQSVRAPSPSPSPSPSPPPPIVRAPPIHQEIITHHRHIDHGFEIAKAPSPPPPPRSTVGRSKETEIDIYQNGRGNTEIDITKTSRNNRAMTPQPPPRRKLEFFDDQDIYENDREKLRVRDTQVSLSRRRSVDSRPDWGREKVKETRIDIRGDEDEADYYARKNQERAYIGEAYNGATKDWSIVDVPPGTERVQLDGVGGGSEEITWQRYNGVRRSKFIPEREREPVRERITERISDHGSSSGRERETTGMEISIRTSDNRREEPRDSGVYTREYERIEETTNNDRRVGLPRGPTRQRPGELWTEITKDLVVREAIEEMGYDFEETEYFYYVIQYLRYEDVLQLVQLSERIRQERQHRIAEIARERERMERKEREREEYEREREAAWRSTRFGKEYDDERIIEREIIYDGRGPRRYR